MVSSVPQNGFVGIAAKAARALSACLAIGRGSTETAGRRDKALGRQQK
jgi:hypothetical protein